MRLEDMELDGGGMRLFVDGAWRSIPVNGGPVEWTGLEAVIFREKSGPWSFLKIRLCNRSAESVRLGACHLCELRGIEGTGPEDTLFLDSGGGWFAGAIRVSAAMPQDDSEYWNPIFCSQEDIA